MVAKYLHPGYSPLLDEAVEIGKLGCVRRDICIMQTTGHVVSLRSKQ